MAKQLLLERKFVEKGKEKQGQRRPEKRKWKGKLGEIKKKYIYYRNKGDIQ